MDSIDKIVDDLVRKLKAIMDAAVNYNEKDGGKRNSQAAHAATNNWNSAKELHLGANSTVPNKLKEQYDYTKYWEDKFNNVWGGHENTYAGYCHGQAKNFYYDAIRACKSLGETITSVNSAMVLQFTSPQGRPGENNIFEAEVEITSGYSRTTSVEAELHTKISAEAKASADYLAASVESSVGSEIAASIRGSAQISNSQEKTEKIKITLNLETPAYVYQTCFNAIMADGTTIKGWGTGYIVSSVSII